MGAEAPEGIASKGAAPGVQSGWRGPTQCPLEQLPTFRA